MTMSPANQPATTKNTKATETTGTSVYLIGTGVVGSAILRSHVDAGISVTVMDQDVDSLQDAIARLQLDRARWTQSTLQTPRDDLPSIELRCLAPATASLAPSPSPNTEDSDAASKATVIIESVSERLQVKQQLFAQAEKRWGKDAILCSNTSTLRIGAIADKLDHPQRCCGMHFFMPVDQRRGVEVVWGPQTSAATIETAIAHTRRLGKNPLEVRDGPGFIVNRLLSPYLNEAMLLLGRGISGTQIETAALAYGMPMSPLELSDWIGTRTMFDAGRVYWQAYPHRIDPSPILPALIKAKRFGRSTGAGFYDYGAPSRAASLAPETEQLSQRYQRDRLRLTDQEVMQLLAIPMWIEAALALREGITSRAGDFDVAMHGGLGFDPNTSWLNFFESLGSASIRDAMARWSPLTKSMHGPDLLIEQLRQHKPTLALEKFAASAKPDDQTGTAGSATGGGVTSGSLPA